MESVFDFIPLHHFGEPCSKKNQLVKTAYRRRMKMDNRDYTSPRNDNPNVRHCRNLIQKESLPSCHPSACEWPPYHIQHKERIKRASRRSVLSHLSWRG